MTPTPATAVDMGVVVVVSMRGGIRQLSQDQGSTRREVKGHTPTPTVRGEGEDGEMGESAESDMKFTKMKKCFVFFFVQEETFMAEMKLGIICPFCILSITGFHYSCILCVALFKHCDVVCTGYHNSVELTLYFI